MTEVIFALSVAALAFAGGALIGSVVSFAISEHRRFRDLVSGSFGEQTQPFAQRIEPQSNLMRQTEISFVGGPLDGRTLPAYFRVDAPLAGHFLRGEPIPDGHQWLYSEPDPETGESHTYEIVGGDAYYVGPRQL